MGSSRASAPEPSTPNSNGPILFFELLDNNIAALASEKIGLQAILFLLIYLVYVSAQIISPFLACFVSRELK